MLPARNRRDLRQYSAIIPYVERRKPRRPPKPGCAILLCMRKLHALSDLPSTVFDLWLDLLRLIGPACNRCRLAAENLFLRKQLVCTSIAKSNPVLSKNSICLRVR